MNKLAKYQKKELRVKVEHFMDDRDYHYSEKYRWYNRKFPYNLAKIAMHTGIGKGAVRTIINDILAERRRSEETIHKIDSSLDDKLNSIDHGIVREIHHLAKEQLYRYIIPGKSSDYNYIAIGRAVNLPDLNLVRTIIDLDPELRNRNR